MSVEMLPNEHDFTESPDGELAFNRTRLSPETLQAAARLGALIGKKMATEGFTRAKDFLKKAEAEQRPDYEIELARDQVDFHHHVALTAPEQPQYPPAA